MKIGALVPAFSPLHGVLSAFYITVITANNKHPSQDNHNVRGFSALNRPDSPDIGLEPLRNPTYNNEGALT
ncbi:hypothetical protein BDW66DRAFT_137169 [Aspergillus desertorum]